MKNSKDAFIKTITKFNIKPSYFYTDFKKVINHFEDFKKILNQIGIVNSSNDFINKIKKIYKENREIIKVFPIFSAIRHNNKIVLNDEGIIIKSFNEKNVTFNQAIEFLKTVGFLSFIDKVAPLDLKSYFLGVEVGMDTNARKNRSGKQMEFIVKKYLSTSFSDSEVITQANLKKINNFFNINISSRNPSFKRNKFDFVVKKDKTIWFIETNFFNSGGSKPKAVLKSYCDLSNDISNLISNEYKINFVLITDGAGLLEMQQQLWEIFSKIKNVYNLNDLKEKGLIKIFGK